MANKTSYELKKTAKLTEYETSNCMLYHLKKKKPLIRPIITYGSESWLLSKKNGSMLRIFKRILRMIYGPITDNGI